MSTGGKKHEDVLCCLSFHRPRDCFEDRVDPIPSQYCRRRDMPFAQRIAPNKVEDDSLANKCVPNSDITAWHLQLILSRFASVNGRDD
jgi:hypothetical protein